MSNCQHRAVGKLGSNCLLNNQVCLHVNTSRGFINTQDLQKYNLTLCLHCYRIKREINNSSDIKCSAANQYNISSVYESKAIKHKYI